MSHNFSIEVLIISKASNKKNTTIINNLNKIFSSTNMIYGIKITPIKISATNECSLDTTLRPFNEFKKLAKKFLKHL